jgi:hypothetical protein
VVAIPFFVARAEKASGYGKGAKGEGFHFPTPKQRGKGVKKK